MPSVIRDKIVRGSNAERREAMSRIMTGTGLAAIGMSLAKGFYGDDICLTGYGPTDKQERSTWLQNNRPYSIGIRKDDGTWEWIGYERYDPISGILAAMVDTADTLEHMDSVEMADDLVLNIGFATMRYVGTALPMTQFLGELINLGGSPFLDTDSKVDRVRELVAKQGTTAGLVVGQQIGTAGLAPQSLLAQAERYMDPFARSTVPDSRYNYVPGVGMQPEPRFQGDVKYTVQGKARGNIWHTFVPMRVQKLPQANVINEELERLGLGFKMLPQSMGEPMIKLNGQQYDRYIELYNYPERSDFAQEYFGTKFGGQIPSNAVSRFGSLILNDDSYKQKYDFVFQKNTNTTPKEKIDRLRGLDTEHKKWAKDLMLLEFSELRALINQRDSYADYRGKNPEMLFAPTEQEKEAARQQNQRALSSLGLQ